MSPQWNRLTSLRDELSKKAHHMEESAQEKWHAISAQIEKLEQALIEFSEDLGKAEEEWFVGEEEEIQRLTKELEALKESQNGNSQEEDTQNR